MSIRALMYWLDLVLPIWMVGLRGRLLVGGGVMVTGGQPSAAW